jgi:hypothetical protein
VKEQHPEEWKEYLRGHPHPFTGGHGACQFLATFTKKRKSKAKLKGSSTDESFTSSMSGKIVINYWKL